MRANNHYSKQDDPARPAPRMPVIASEWRRITTMPDLGDLAGPDPRRQHIVDHGFIQARDGSWQLWGCLRGTKVSRLLFGWRSPSLFEGPWEEIGVVARAEAQYGEKTDPEQIGAPFFFRDDDRYLCFYHSGGIRLMDSDDGIRYRRVLNSPGDSSLRSVGGRDAMVFKEDGVYYLYSTVSTVSRDGFRRGFAIVETSADLKQWSDYTIVSEGGVAGNGAVSAESPFVVKVEGCYYLFRASSITFKTYVYRSLSPYHFGVNDDSKLIAEFPIKAPEIVLHEGEYYISDLADFQGLKMARLRWETVS